MRFYRQVHDVYCKIRNCSRGIKFTLSQTLTTSNRPLLARFCNRIWTNKSRSLQYVHNFNNLPVFENFPSFGCPVSHLKTRENNAQCICEALEQALNRPYKYANDNRKEQWKHGPQTWKESTRKKNKYYFFRTNTTFTHLIVLRRSILQLSMYHISFLWLESVQEGGASKYGRIMKKKTNILVQMILSAEFEPLSTTSSMKYFCKCHLSRHQENFACIGIIFNKNKVP